MRNLGQLIRRPSTRASLRALRASIKSAFTEASKQLTDAGHLAKHCRGKTDLKLNIGCGDFTPPGWVNADLAPKKGRSFYLDVRDGLPILADTVRHIHCEHFVEHLEYEVAVEFFGECRRVLRQNGTLRVVVPDLEKYIRAYYENDTEFFDRFRRLGGAQRELDTKALVLNQMARMGGAHRLAWDFETISKVLFQQGFSKVARSSPGDVNAEFAIDLADWWRPVESLYVNAAK